MTEENRRKYRPRTQGVKGAKMPRINMAFDQDVYAFIREQAGTENTTMTQIVNEAVRDKMIGRGSGDHGKA